MLQSSITELVAWVALLLAIIALLRDSILARMELQRHRPYLQLSWDRMPPPKQSDTNTSVLCVENRGSKEAIVQEIRIDYSYVDEPVFIEEPGIIGPSLVSRYAFEFITPPPGDHVITASVRLKYGFGRKKKRKYRARFFFTRK